ncbi:MAG TPA: DUF488 domain-containing protein [Phycisphaerales bacterium]|nr:DUF488 domain-containing protein [Phycisphaerales bacterium]
MAATADRIRIKRIYDDPSPEDGLRVLVDRLWPRGMSKERAKVDLWLKEVSPSADLRVWFGHDPEKWGEFRKRYRAELAGGAALDELRTLVREHSGRGKQGVTLLYGAKVTDNNHAIVLREAVLDAGKAKARER